MGSLARHGQDGRILHSSKKYWIRQGGASAERRGGGTQVPRGQEKAARVPASRRPLVPASQEFDSIKALEDAVARLPRRTREIFLAHRVDGLACAEIAVLTGLSTRRVERHLARAIYRLSKELDREPLRWRERLLGW
jgi:RNA polymerase sigma factor (sigma-70 family)